MHSCRPEHQLHQRRIPYLLHLAPQPIRPDLALDAGRAGFGARRDGGRGVGDGGGEGAGRRGDSCAKEGHGDVVVVMDGDGRRNAQKRKAKDGLGRISPINARPAIAIPSQIASAPLQLEFQFGPPVHSDCTECGRNGC